MFVLVCLCLCSCLCMCDSFPSWLLGLHFWVTIDSYSTFALLIAYLKGFKCSDKTLQSLSKNLHIGMGNHFLPQTKCGCLLYLSNKKTQKKYLEFFFQDLAHVCKFTVWVYIFGSFLHWVAAQNQENWVAHREIYLWIQIPIYTFWK